MPVRENPQHSPQWNVYLGGETSSSLLDPFFGEVFCNEEAVSLDPNAALLI